MICNHREKLDYMPIISCLRQIKNKWEYTSKNILALYSSLYWLSSCSQNEWFPCVRISLVISICFKNLKSPNNYSKIQSCIFTAKTSSKPDIPLEQAVYKPATWAVEPFESQSEVHRAFWGFREDLYFSIIPHSLSFFHELLPYSQISLTLSE